MQRGRVRRGDLFDFGDPFGGFGGFGDHRSLMSSFFGKDPFDDPFFNRPFGSMFGPSILDPHMMGMGGNLFRDSFNSGFIEHQAPQPKKSSGPVIQELSSDDEEENDGKNKEINSGKHPRISKEPFVQHPDEETEEKSKYIQYRNDYNRADRGWPQSQTFSFQSSTTTYGGANGAYYTSSTTRRMGSDGVAAEESRVADTSTGRATHRISRGIHDKGHSITRKLDSDGKVDTMQMLHNLNEDELAGFEEAWNGKAKKHLPGWNQGFDMLNNGREGSSAGGQRGQTSRGWALPSAEETLQSHERMRSQGNTRANSFSRRA